MAEKPRDENLSGWTREKFFQAGISRDRSAKQDILKYENKTNDEIFQANCVDHQNLRHKH